MKKQMLVNEGILQIFIITYNRAKFLDYTLSKLTSSIFCSCDIFVLDNCSDDETVSVCEKYVNKYKNVKIVRHKKNIGGSANYLRAIEMASSEYAWVLCDDDVYDFDSCEDVFQAINGKLADIFFVGSWERLCGLGESLKISDYYGKYKKFFSIAMYVPSVIFKVAKFDSYFIRRGYFNSCNMFPHFSFYLNCYYNNEMVYISNKQIVYCADDGIHGFSKLDLTISYLNLSGQITNSKLRSKFIDEVVFNNEGPHILIGRVLAAKSEYGNPLVYHGDESYFLRALIACMRFNYISFRHKLWFMLSALASLFPRFFCKFFVKTFSKKIREKYNTDLPEMIVSLRNERQLQGELRVRQLERMKNM